MIRRTCLKGTEKLEGEFVRVLLVDDDALLSQTLPGLLKANASTIEFEVADTLSKGLARIDEGQIDIVLLNLTLPDSGGISTLLKLRKQAPAVPVIVLSARDDHSIASQSLQAGAQDYLIKPDLDAARVRRAMQHAIERQHGIARDINEGRKAEEKLREQAELLDAARDAIIVLDLNDKIIFWNLAAEKIYGYTAGEIMSTHVVDRVDESLKNQWIGNLQQIRTSLFEKGEWAGELVNLTKDGRNLTVDCSCSLMRDEAGEAKSILVIATDVTEKKKLEAQFQKMQRMESLGALASGIAHDLNNWLAPILTSIHTLQQRFTDPNSQKWLSIIRKSAERSRDLVDQVLIFAKGKGGERVVLNTSRLVSDAAKILRETLPRGYVLDIQLAGSLWGVLGDATQLHQVLMNLCLNARDAMPDGGALTISASNVTLSEDDVWMVEELPSGNYVQIAVKDTGAGMSQEMIDRIFEPFYTTKKDGLGTGLGLSITLGIVRSHGGVINVTSSLNQGSQFEVLLPASEIRYDETSSGIESALPSGNGELVLVVDDEEDIREITVATLESCGYRAMGAGSGPDALHLCSERQAELRLVIADLALPSLNEDFFRSQVLQKIPIIGTSGLRSQEQAERARRAGIETMLWKPYTAQQLLSAIEKNLS